MRYIIFFSFLLMGWGGLNAQEDELQTFRLEMQRELARAQNNVQQLEKRVTDKHYAPQSSDKIALQNAIIMLDVKTTIVNKFSSGTTAINDPAVRQTILAILRKDMITAGDLTALQAVVNEAHRKEAQQQQPQTSKLSAVVQTLLSGYAFV